MPKMKTEANGNGSGMLTDIKQETSDVVSRTSLIAVSGPLCQCQLQFSQLYTNYMVLNCCSAGSDNGVTDRTLYNTVNTHSLEPYRISLPSVNALVLASHLTGSVH